VASKENESAIMTSNYTVLITTSGIGSRLGDLTQYTNKSLIVVGEKPVLAQIIEKYPGDTHFIVTLGYFGDHVKEFLDLCYPERKFTFINISPYDGPGSSLAFSIWSAKEYLQKPFIYHACDTLIIESEIPAPDFDWVGGSKGLDASNYTSFDATHDQVEKFNPKGMIDFDYIHIGLVGIFSFNDFWLELEDLMKEDSSSRDLNDVTVLDRLVKSNVKFKILPFNDWVDIGNSSMLAIARSKASTQLEVLEKPQESVSFIKDFTVKFFADSDIVSERVKRVEYLGEIVPLLRGSGKNHYIYDFYPGKSMAKVDNSDSILPLLKWAKKNLWSLKPKTSPVDFTSIVKSFYIDKTKERLSMFLKSRSLKDETSSINGVVVPTAKELIKLATPILLGDISIGRFHGDFILSNIIYSENGFKLIDWRQNFGKSLEFGDVYYDYAKLNHSLHINHSLVLGGNFYVSENETEIKCGILRKDVEVEMEHNLRLFIEREDLNWVKIDVLTALIWINMAPLHHHPFDKFLYYYGRYHLWRAISE
jgi:hypothetical protein